MKGTLLEGLPFFLCKKKNFIWIFTKFYDNKVYFIVDLIILRHLNISKNKYVVFYTKYGKLELYEPNWYVKDNIKFIKMEFFLFDKNMLVILQLYSNSKWLLSSLLPSTGIIWALKVMLEVLIWIIKAWLFDYLKAKHTR